MAAQLARWAGATVIGTVVRQTDLDQVNPAAMNSVALYQANAVDAIRARSPDGVHRIIEVALPTT